MTYNVCLMGASLETGNMGVSALAASTIKNIIEIRPDANISLLIGYKTPKIRDLDISGKKIQIKVINYRLSPWARIHEHLFSILLMACVWRVAPFGSIREKITILNPWLNSLHQADFVGNIHGGDSFSDIYGLNRYIIGIIPNIIALLMKKKLVLLPQTYGPYDFNISKLIAGFIMRHSDKILSRDKKSIEIAIEMIGKKGCGKEVKFCPDVAFTLDSTNIIKPQIEPKINQTLKVPLVGINVNGLMYNGGYTRANMFGLKCDYKTFIIKIVERLLLETTAHILLVPHTFGPAGNVNSDPDTCRDVLKKINDLHKNRVHLVMREYDQSEIKAIIGRCDFFVGSRMHACIAALSQRIPTVGVAYSRKFSGVFESIGVGDMVADARYLDTDAAINKVLSSFENRTKVKAKLQEKIDTAISQIKKTFEEVLCGWL